MIEIINDKIKTPTLFILPMILGFPHRPNMIALTNVDFPVPFGPIIMFNDVPGYNSTSL